MSLIGVILAMLLALVYGLIVMVTTPPCQHCYSRNGYRWKYPRVDGGPDRRRVNNSLICKKCGEVQAKRFEPVMPQSDTPKPPPSFRRPPPRPTSQLGAIVTT